MNTHSLEKKLAALDEVGEALSDGMREVNAFLKTCEERVIASHIGLEMWVSLPGKTVPVEYLGFAKLNTGWQLAYGVEELRGDDDTREGDPPLAHIIPLTQARREVRITAVEAIPELLEALAEQGRKLLQKIPLV